METQEPLSLTTVGPPTSPSSRRVVYLKTEERGQPRGITGRLESQSKQGPGRKVGYLVDRRVR